MRKAADARVEQAKLEKAATRFGTPVKVDVVEGLLGEWYRTNGIVAFYQAEIEALEAGDHHRLNKVGSAEVDGLVTLYNENRRHLVSLGVQLARLGIAEKALAIEAAKAVALAQPFLAVLSSSELGLTAEQQQVARGLLRRQLEALRPGQ